MPETTADTASSSVAPARETAVRDDGIPNDRLNTQQQVRREDELLACLILLARAHGATLTPDAALAGLPTENGRLSPSLFDRAARRAGLSSRTVRQPISCNCFLR